MIKKTFKHDNYKILQGINNMSNSSSVQLQYSSKILTNDDNLTKPQMNAEIPPLNLGRTHHEISTEL